eukprot:CAMPEP_0118887048 /NCGR_PEP_ID=MMETSP1163-20130328/24908_1 /TAXON_ID=124430 /ORGANISM="Phaeomonas parva, Strain CCMP2877" /LENGTH=71 /DNA_ID=CAMNT_0006825397 /DNA_START=65 /DNA_END=278 /DNA_ORIENTATION=-
MAGRYVDPVWGERREGTAAVLRAAKGPGLTPSSNLTPTPPDRARAKSIVSRTRIMQAGSRSSRAGSRTGAG